MKKSRLLRITLTVMIIVLILADIVPFEAIRPYDIRKVIEQVVDADSFLEVQKEFARNIVIGLCSY